MLAGECPRSTACGREGGGHAPTEVSWKLFHPGALRVVSTAVTVETGNIEERTHLASCSSRRTTRGRDGDWYQKKDQERDDVRRRRARAQTGRRSHAFALGPVRKQKQKRVSVLRWGSNRHGRCDTVLTAFGRTTGRPCERHHATATNAGDDWRMGQDAAREGGRRGPPSGSGPPRQRGGLMRLPQAAAAAARRLRYRQPGEGMGGRSPGPLAISQRPRERNAASSQVSCVQVGIASESTGRALNHALRLF